MLKYLVHAVGISRTLAKLTLAKVYLCYSQLSVIRTSNERNEIY